MANLTKDKVVELLKKEGIHAKLENGVVMLVYDFDTKDEQIEEFCQTLEKLDYHCSFGYRGKNSVDRQNFSDAEKE